MRDLESKDNPLLKLAATDVTYAKINKMTVTSSKIGEYDDHSRIMH